MTMRFLSFIFQLIFITNIRINLKQYVQYTNNLHIVLYLYIIEYSRILNVFVSKFTISILADHCVNNAENGAVPLVRAESEGPRVPA